eukprot:symbB.v1.2.018701.t1/scaffold1503.1/size115030/2
MEGELQRKFGSDHGDEWSCHEGAVPCQGCSTASGRSPERLVNFRELLHCMTKLCAQLRCPREHLALLAARDVKFEDLKHQDVACNACCGIRCQLDDEMTGRSVETWHALLAMQG